jgi:hypothetical protein
MLISTMPGACYDTATLGIVPSVFWKHSMRRPNRPADFAVGGKQLGTADIHL